MHRVQMRTPWQNFLAALPLATAAALAACGGSSPPAENPTTTVDGGAAPAASASAAAVTDAGANATPNPSPADQPKTATTEAPKFDDLPKEKKVDIMVSKVVPNVGKLFKEHDAKRYGKFGCTTCHGPDKKQDPHDVLPKLTLSGGGFDKLAKNKPEVLKWMTGVEHEMASALNEPVYDPATKKGFGCAGCHTVN
jgi:hypothetical protein